MTTANVGSAVPGLMLLASAWGLFASNVYHAIPWGALGCTAAIGFAAGPLATLLARAAAVLASTRCASGPTPASWTSVDASCRSR